MSRWILNSLAFILLVARIVAQDAPEEEKPKTDSNATATAEESLKDESKSKKKRSVRIEASHRGSDRTVFGDNVVIGEGEIVHDVVVIGGSAMIDGKVTGDLVVIGGFVTLGPKAEVARDLTIIGGGLEKDPTAKIGGERTVLDFGGELPTFHGIPSFRSDWLERGLLKGRLLVPQVRWNLIAAGIFILLYVVIALLFPGPMEATMGTLDKRPGSSFLIGILAFVLFAPLLVLLCVTVIGLVLVPFLVCAGFAAFLFGKAAVYGYAGRRIGGGVQSLRHPLVAVLIGAILFCILYMVPVLGMLLWLIVAPLGVGAVLLAFFGRVRKESPPVLSSAGGGMPPAPPVMGVAPETGAVAGMAAPLNPSTAIQSRAGFWLRFVGTVIDAALVITVFVMFFKTFGMRGGGGFFFFLLLWSAYHITMWTLRGATLGGLALGLRLVQTDGQPVNLAVAIVRFLASFLSAAALLIGFFWAGWSSEKQSWHDKIAGTYVLKGVRSKVAPVSQPA